MNPTAPWVEEQHFLMAARDTYRVLTPCASLARMTRGAALLVMLVVTGCSGASATTTEEPRRYTDYHGTYSPVADQCSLPVEERTEGWFCYQPE